MFLLTCVLCEESDLMKLAAVNNEIIRQNRLKNSQNNDNKKTQNNVAFKGFADAATVFWNFVDKGGRGLQFTIEDMLGTNFPRTYKGAMAGYKYTGKINFRALLQEAIREFLTGPTMTLAPIAILGIIKGMSGETANVHRENIVNLSHIVSTLGEKNLKGDEFKTEFLEKVVDDLLKQTTGKVTPDDKEVLKDGFKKYASLVTNKDKKGIKQHLASLEETFESIIKANKDSYKDTNFQTVKYSLDNNGKVGATNFVNYVKYVTAYGNDYVKANTKNGIVDLTASAISKFKTNWVGKRAMTIASMILLTGTIMTFIPKLYTLASGTRNPNGEGVYEEAKRREGKK